ncbi:hypothetical protein OPT61_g4984 [Boeremia exigua]|uniref:Uncharacterized protein n=1 Tax=Boeremia exigua TaxID=749465 RepID=A0ACC2IC41_9PLEO|nr:hypothetical protein OPT61_g4984 [Boeremia exigua]
MADMDIEFRTEPALKARVSHATKVTPSSPDYPRSHTANYCRPAPITYEEEVLDSIKREWKSSSENHAPPETTEAERTLIIAELIDFEIYRPKTDRIRSLELTGLHLFDVKARNLCFDGYVLFGKGSLGLEDLTRDFHRWLVGRFGHNTEFQEWLAAFRNTTDFRVAFNAYAEFFYNQALNLSTSEHLTSHPIWAHCMCDRMLAVEKQPNLIKYTLATPHVYQSFRHMYFAEKLKSVPISGAVRKMRKKRMATLGFAAHATVPPPSTKSDKNGSNVSDACVGDVIAIAPDGIDKTCWQRSGDEWLAYVQGVEHTTEGAQRLKVLWLYRPADTNICRAHYSVRKELFLSDNCNRAERDILSTDVIRKYTAEWSPRSLDTVKDFIIRQTYLTNDSAFIATKDDHKICSCRKPKPDTVKWAAGHAVYIKKNYKWSAAA